MADEKEAAVDAAAEAAPADQPKDKTKNMVIVMVVLAIVVMVLTPVITIFAVKAMQKKETAAVAVPEKKEALEIKMPRIEVNVKDTQGTRIIQVDTFVVVSDASEMGPIFQEQKEAKDKGRLRKINDMLITIFTSKNLDGLLSAEAKERLKKEIKDALNEYLRNELHTEGLVTDIYFTRFIVQ